MKVLIGLCLISVVSAAGWSYDGNSGSLVPRDWVSDYSICSASNTRQSPIDIKAEMYDEDLGDFTMKGYETMQTRGKLNIVNNGHTVRVDVNEPTKVNVTGGGLSGEYLAAQLHFHWGDSDMSGSEHYFRGNQYPMEVHIVHYKAAYGDLTTAVSNGDGLAVLGFFFEVSTNDNSNLQPIIDALDGITYKNENAEIDMNFADILPDLDHQEYYRYLGSLTTPTCAESVVWTVFENKIKISSRQLAKFRQLKQHEASSGHDDLLTFNYRPLQALSDRSVYKNYKAAVPSSYHWEYHGPSGSSSWPTYYPTCVGKMQSPIDIPAVTSPNIAQYDSTKALNTLEFKNYDASITGTIKNNGHTIQVDVDNTNMYIQKGGLKDRYNVAQFHFHWGTDNNHGSEHTHNGKQYPLELHIVHYNAKYGSLAGAVGHHDGLAVVGFWYEVGNSNNRYANIISRLPDVQFKGASKAINGITLNGLTHSDLRSSPNQGRSHNFYRYEGGLTTPGCNEIVTWTVMTTTIKLSNAQLAAFRDMLHISDPGVGYNPFESDKIGSNYRPTQMLYNRVVHTSWNWQSDEDLSAAPKATQSLTLCAALVLMGFLLR